MIKVVIIEDEYNAREALKKMLPLVNSSVTIVGFASHIKEATELIRDQTPDLVFMDIELEDGTGFDVLNAIENKNFKLIFTTAYNQYAVKAFKYSSIDYLLKPIDPQELKTAIDKAVTLIDTEKEYHQLLEVLQHNLEHKNEKIVLKTTENRYVLSVNDIIRLEADGAYTLFFTQDKKITVSKNLKFYENILGEQFIRSHQSHLININHLVSMNKNDHVELTNGDTVPVSTRKKSNLIKLLK